MLNRPVGRVPSCPSGAVSRAGKLRPFALRRFPLNPIRFLPALALATLALGSGLAFAQAGTGNLYSVTSKMEVVGMPFQMPPPCWARLPEKVLLLTVAAPG